MSDQKTVLVADQLTSIQKDQVRSLVEASKEMEPTTISFPFEAADFYYYLELNGTIISIIAFTEESPDCLECCAFTDPRHRRCGLFTRLIDEVQERIPEETMLIFYTDGKSKSALETLHIFETDLIMEEYMMEIPLNSLPEKVIHSGRPEERVCMEETLLDGTQTYRYTSPYGVVSISVFSSYYYLYGLEIKERFRGMGYGKKLLYHVLKDLTAKNPLPLRLQVSGSNVTAFTLYKETGFRITETLLGYLY